MALARQGNQGPGKPAIEGAGRKRRDTGRFDAAIERFVVSREPFVMGSVAWLVDVQDRDDQAGPFMVTANTAGRLDVLGAGLGLAENDHQAEPGDIEADRNHVGGDRHVDASFSLKGRDKSPFGFGDLGRADAAGQFDGS